MESQRRPGQPIHEVEFNEMKVIKFSQLSPTNRYVACSDDNNVFIWDLLRNELVGLCKMEFYVDRYDFDAKETQIFIYDSTAIRIHVFSLTRDGLRGGGVIQPQGYLKALLYCARTGHMVVYATENRRVLLDFWGPRELEVFDSQCHSFAIDVEANSLFYKRSQGREIGLVDLATLKTKKFADSFEFNVFTFLGSSRRELYSCTWRQMVIFDVESGNKLRFISFQKILFEISWIIKWRNGFFWVAVNNSAPFVTLCYNPSTEVPMIYGTHEETHPNRLRGNTRFSFNGYFSAAFRNTLRVSRIDKQNSSAILSVKVHSPSCLKISGNRITFPRKRHQNLYVPSPFTPPPRIDPTCSGFAQNEIFPSSSHMHTWPQNDLHWEATIKAFPDALQFKVIRSNPRGSEFKVCVRSKFLFSL